MTAIPDRLWYSVNEAAHLMGVGKVTLYGLIKAGKRTDPPADAIPARHVRQIAGRICLSRAYVIGDQLAPVTPVVAGPTRDDLKAAFLETLIDVGTMLQAERSLRKVG